MRGSDSDVGMDDADLVPFARRDQIVGSYDALPEFPLRIVKGERIREEREKIHRREICDIFVIHPRSELLGSPYATLTHSHSSHLVDIESRISTTSTYHKT